MRIAVLFLLACGSAAAADYRISTVATGLDHPWSLASLPDGRLLVTERSGRLRVIENGQLRPQAIAGVPAVLADGQGGLFEVLPDAHFADNQLLYLSFAAGSRQANSTNVVRARLAGEKLVEVKTIFVAKPLKKGTAHYGARMLQLDDGSLLVGLGDGFAFREEAQNLRSHLGKIVRIDGDGSVPRDNPFVGRADVLPEIYSYGHRNVQGLAFDAQNHIVYAHEHGPRGGDEINRIEAGRNYGWPLITYGLDYTGAVISPFTQKPGLEQPLLQWTPSIAPAGMVLYRGDAFPQWRGSLVVSALAAQQARRVPITDGKAGTQEILFAELKKRLRDVRVAADGGLYLLTDYSAGEVLKVDPPR
ncbi:glucose/arabinose dehydrogenase [Tahibacter aquaticus]|uniref:Glucose/arabinose dehydrogenase n=1 Tax=Tahibacter aquaticus TaxID=520092 RepID=A0A4R6YIQ6_9GAMM|nr:PQQ-dependent sugar dehydrogenase [Tahibacter aquaticus]TDR36672.1 glucose/arabinose dehydrogenase [Tahibacter aquaticus]